MNPTTIQIVADDDKVAAELAGKLEQLGYRVSGRTHKVPADLQLSLDQHPADQRRHAQKHIGEAALIDRILRVFAETDGVAMFEQVLQIVQQGLASRHGVFGYVWRTGELICPSLSKMLDRCEVVDKCIHYPPDKWKGLWARALREKRSFFSNDSFTVPVGHPKIYNNLAAPILFHNEVIGLLNLANKAGDYTESDQALLDNLAERIAPLLYAWIQKKMSEEERAIVTKVLRREAQLLDQVHDAVIATDLEGHITLWNAGARRLFGYTEKEVLDHHISLIYFEEDRPGLAAGMIEPLLKNGTHESETRCRTKSGRTIFIHLSLSVLRHEDGIPYGLIGFSLDITERRMAEQVLQQMNEILEQRVDERTKLAESRSRQLQELAVELIDAEERERRRVADLLHEDLQQILAFARMQLQAACEHCPPDPMLSNVVHLLEECIGKTRRLSHELSPAVLQHSGLMAGLQWLVGQMKDQFGLQVRIESEEFEALENDALKVFVFRAVQELLFNVIKHAGVQNAQVAISNAGSCLAITVSDTGCGIDPNVLDSTCRSPGLGLISIRERARHIGGDLTIDGATGKGSRFNLLVPLRLEHPGTSKQETNAEPSRAKALVACDTQVFAGGSIRVLFVDDHRVMRHGLIHLMAGQPGIEVAGEAADGGEALEKARLLHPDLILMDVSMPVMDGIEATHRIKAEMPETRIIGLSMHDDEHLSREMCEAGADAFLIKTVSSTELLKTIYAIAVKPPNLTPRSKQPLDRPAG